MESVRWWGDGRARVAVRTARKAWASIAGRSAVPGGPAADVVDDRTRPGPSACLERRLRGPPPPGDPDQGCQGGRLGPVAAELRQFAAVLLQRMG